MTFDMTTANILRRLMAERGLTQIQLAEALGVSRQSVSRWLKGYPIDDKNLKKLAAYFGISEQQLRFGRAAPVSVYDEGDTPPDDVVVIHEYRLTFGAAAEGREPEPEWEIVEGGDDFWYKRSFFQKRYLNPDKCKLAKVTGDSMEPFIFSGDTVLFSEVCDPRPTCVTIQDGKVYVISVDGKLKIKRLASIKDGIAVRSDNPSYKTEEFTGEELARLRIFGRVVEISRSV